MRALIYCLLLITLASCNNSARPGEPVARDTVSTAGKPDSVLSYIHSFGDSALEDKITDALMKLSFVKKSNAYIDSFSNHKHGIAFMVDSLGKDEQEISVKAGYNGDERFETYYMFYVNPKTMEIKVYDVVNDKKMSVKEYIKSQHP